MAGYDEFEDEPTFPIRVRKPIVPGASTGGEASIKSRQNGGDADGHTPGPEQIAEEQTPRLVTKPTKSWRDQTIGAQDLCDKRFAEVRYIVPGLLPEGVTLLVSRPKLGKSWLLLQIGSDTAMRQSSLVDVDYPVCGDVLYLNLEDGDRRAQRRMAKYFGAERENWPQRLTLARAWRRLNQGGLEDLREWCESVEQPTLIMIDTLKRARPEKKKGQSDYDADYEACEGLLKLAHEFPGLGFIVTHHDRKGDAVDVFDTVSGTLGLTAGVDTIAVLKRSGHGVTLHIEGRDLADATIEKAVRFDPETARWSILGEAAAVHRSAERNRVLDVLKLAPLNGMSTVEIMAAAELVSRPAVEMLLTRMVRDGEIERKKRGRYGLVSVGGPVGGVGSLET